MLDAEPVPMPTRRRSWFRATIERVHSHPLLTVVIVASTLRFGLAVASFLVHHGFFIPDEYEYLRLTRLVAHGHPAGSIANGYGQQLYDSTWPFSAGVVFCFHLFGSSRLVAQLYVVLFGTATAALTYLVARRVVRVEWAVAGGLLVAVMPSQVLWSSIVLREAPIWACLVAIAGLVAWSLRAPGGRAALGVSAVALVLFGLIHLRAQTAVVAALALAVAAFVMPRTARLTVPAALLAVAVLVPLATGLGPAGLGLVTNAASTLGRTRAYLGFAADSALPVDTAAAQQPVRTDCSTNEPPTVAAGNVGAEALATVQTERVGHDRYVVCDHDGHAVVVAEGPMAELKHLPAGVAATLLRPYPWEHSRNAQTLFATIEDLAWYALYAIGAVALALAGWTTIRRLAFPLALFVAFVGSSALSQGNLGTAFRHRGEVLWVLALLAAVAAERLTDRRRASGVAVRS